MDSVAWFFTDYMTPGRWAITWFLGLVIAFFSTAFDKQKEDRAIGFFIYMVVTVAIVSLWAIGRTISTLWNLAA